MWMAVNAKSITWETSEQHWLSESAKHRKV